MLPLVQVRPTSDCHRGLGAALVIVLLASWEARAQGLQGSWTATFDHSTTAPMATDFTAPFRGPGYEPPATSGVFSWGYYTSGGGNYQPVHMALIPKGPHQGRVLVWDEWPVVLRASSALDSANRYWSCQSWSIVDPTVVQARFRNFLLPFVGFVPPRNVDATDLNVPFGSVVCSGHAWSQEGDLVVAGGEAGLLDGSVSPPWISYFEITKYLMLFDPMAPSQPFELAGSLYPGEVGCWKSAPNLELLVGRWYPTVTLSQRLTRNGLDNEVVMVSGGSDFATNQVLNTYESFVVRASNSPAGFLTRDPDHGNPVQVLPGPGGTLNPNQREILGLYPRVHLLSSGDLFVSGYGPDASRFNLDAPLATRTWNRTVGRVGSIWNDLRENGASIFYARMAGGTLDDIVVRFGGWNSIFLPTDAAEACIASSPAAPWMSLPSIPGNAAGTLGRTDLNAIILPDATVLVIGGTAVNTTQPGYAPVLAPALYVPGTNSWHVQPAEPTLAPRRYHSTAMLLPDGTVIVGGGNDRATGVHPDYAVFSPHYLQGNPLRPQIAAISGPPGSVSVDPADGTWLLNGHDPVTGNPVPLTLDCTSVATADAIIRIVLIAPGSVTHHGDMTARYVELPSTAISNVSRSFTTLDGNRLPRGYYMAFALNTQNVPSRAAWVKIRS